MQAETPPTNPQWRRFAGILGALFALRLLVDQISIRQPALALVGQLFITALFLIGPITAMYLASRWLNARRSLALLLLGGALHLGGALASRALGKEPSFSKVVLESLAMTGLSLWTTGLGGLVASIIKDKNLIPSIAIFLVGFDMFLIFNPTSVTQTIMQQKPEVFQAVAYQVPSFGIGPAAYIGPADFFVLGLLFVTLFRFRMRAEATFKWSCVALLLYMFVVMFLGDLSIGPVSLGQLPALVPIGLVALVLNWREFRMSRSEAGMTAFVGVIALALAAYGIYRAATEKKDPVPPPQTIEVIEK